MVALSTLSTPAFVVDFDRALGNCERMGAKAARSGVLFRPHVKTHKTTELARMQGGGEPGPITVSTMAEAEFFASAGFTDLTYAVPIAPEKLDRAAGLARRIDRLNLLLDHVDTLRAMEAFATAHGGSFDVFLKVDCGYGRAGVDPGSPGSVELARALAASPFVRFRGLLTHAGHSYHARSREEIESVAVEETSSLSRFASRLGLEGITALVRSVGSTPTASVVDAFVDCDEVRPGNYVFYDAMQASIGSCGWDECAATVVSTVLGVYPTQNKLVIDAGALALSKDAGAEHIMPDLGFGRVCDLELRPLPMKLVALSQEHGRIECSSAGGVAVGDRLRIIPNHSCLTAALFDRYSVVRAGAIVDEWHPVRGW
jgi:D-serine deaminase-like pyridoxal phosphate-dependent protein